LANALSKEVLIRSLDEASPMSRELVRLIRAMLTQEAEKEKKGPFLIYLSAAGVFGSTASGRLSTARAFERTGGFGIFKPLKAAAME